jgi:hypothetical protein
VEGNFAAFHRFDRDSLTDSRFGSEWILKKMQRSRTPKSTVETNSEERSIAEARQSPLMIRADYWPMQ